LQIGADVQVAAGWTTTQPLDRPADQEVYVPIRGIQLQDPRGLVDVEKHECAFRVCVFDNCASVDAIRAAIRRVRKRDETGFIVDRVEESLEWDRNVVRGGNDFDARANLSLRIPEIFHRREVERSGDDLVSAFIEIETGSDGGEGESAFGSI
jgi:hypothetical protein